MTYDLNQEITDYDGSPIIVERKVDENGIQTDIPLTYKKAVITTLNTPIQTHVYTPEEMTMANSISLKAYEHPESVELSAEETKLIATRAKFVYLTPRIPTQIEEFFNQKN